MDDLRNLTGLALALIATCAAPACGPKVCTLIGCSFGVSLTFRSDDGTWADGAYTFELGFDGREHTCTMTLPEDLPDSASSSTLLDCTSGIVGFLAQERECIETSSGDSVSQRCDPIPGQFSVELSSHDEPASVALIVERDGEELLDETRELTYRESFPNGPECGPPCRNANAEIEL